jgi:IclR family acetate operon transcriptional repressor
MAEQAPQLVQSLERSLRILEVLAEAEQLTLGELARRAQLRPSTAHRLLATLVARGYALRAGRAGSYMLGFRAAALAGVAAERTERLRGCARAHLEAIARQTGESANLSILVAPDAVYVDQVDGTHAVRMIAQLGAAVPAHASAAGKAMLASAPAGALETLLGGGPLAALTPATITALAALERELDAVRARGYAIDDEEHEPGVGCVAAAVLGSDGEALAALSVSAPVQRIRSADPGSLGQLLVREAAAVSRGLAAA